MVIALRARAWLASRLIANAAGAARADHDQGMVAVVIGIASQWPPGPRERVTTLGAVTLSPEGAIVLAQDLVAHARLAQAEVAIETNGNGHAG